jgi:hypothetical protein
MCTRFYPELGSLQVETILTVALVMLTLCGMVRDSTSNAPCPAQPSSATSLACSPQRAGTYNMQRTSLYSRMQRTCMPRCVPRQMHMTMLRTFAQAFSWGGYLPALADGATAHIVVAIAAWVVISVGGCLTLMALAGEASSSVAKQAPEPR